MEQLKLFGEKTWELVTNGIQENGDEISYIFKPNLSETFEQIEAELLKESNTKTVYVVSASGETIRSIVGYTSYQGMEKRVNYEIEADKDATVMVAKMKKPDMVERVKTLEAENRIAMEAVSYAAVTFTNEQAVKVKELYPKWSELKDGTTLTKKSETSDANAITRVVGNDGLLYEVISTHQKQAGWEPGQSTASLFSVIDEIHSGTKEDPIPAYVNMVYKNGKYYIHNGILYKCTRDSEIALQYTPDQLVGQYFEFA